VTKPQMKWEARWSSPGYTPPWRGRPVSKEVVAAVAEEWFAPGDRALDVGCGAGELTAWLAGRGFQALGIDFAAAAIARAQSAHGKVPGDLDFQVLDICAAPPSRGGFGAIVDRGCFHSIAQRRLPDYVKNVAAACTPDAHFLLFVKAFRGEGPIGDPDEREREVAKVRAAFAGEFRIVRVAQTYLDPCEGRCEARALPGLAIWMARRRRGPRATGGAAA
jgi:SAM-dependent methyltransferase